MPEPKDNLGALRLRELFPDRGGQKAIMDATGADRGMVSRWYRGRRRPDPRMRAALQRLYGIGWTLWDEPVPEDEAA